MSVKWVIKNVLKDKKFFDSMPEYFANIKLVPVVPLDEHEKKVEQMQQQLNKSADNALEWQLKYVKLLAETRTEIDQPSTGEKGLYL